MKVLIAGHISLDIRNGHKLLGGPPLYQIPILQAINAEIDVVTACNNDKVNLEKLYPGVKFHILDSPETTTFEFRSNSISTMDDRDLILLQRARDIRLEDIQNLKPEYDLVIISAIAGELSLKEMSQLLSLAKIKFIDLQGIARQFRPNGLAYNEINPSILQYALENFDVVKGSTSELVGFEIAKLKPDNQLIITNNGKSISLVNKNGLQEITLNKIHDVKDSTGSGDIFLAAIALFFETVNITTCISFAHKIAVANLMQTGIPVVENIRDQLELLGINS